MTETPEIPATAEDGSTPYEEVDANDSKANQADKNDADVVANSEPVGSPEVVEYVEPAEEDDSASSVFDGSTSQEDRQAKDEEDAKTRAQVASDSAPTAAAQREADLKFQQENPNVPIARAANPNVGGESF